MKRYRLAGRGFWFGLLGIVLVVGMAGPAWSQELPEGEGKEVVEAACTVCHGLAHFTGSRFSKSDWEYVVNDMIDRGALITDEEATVIVNYLTEHFGPEEKPTGESTTGKSNGNKAAVGEPVAPFGRGSARIGGRKDPIQF